MPQASNQALSDVNSLGAQLAEVKSKLEQIEKQLAPEPPPPPPPEKAKEITKMDKVREELDVLIQQLTAMQGSADLAAESLKKADHEQSKETKHEAKQEYKPEHQQAQAKK